MLMAAREAKNEFGKLLDTAQREPVTIQKKGRSVAVVISMQEYHKLEEYEDLALAAMAEKSEAEGLLSVEESRDLLKEIRNAKS